ncbi:uncharacterized protein LACBIDRAFT_314389 [Laccaria bicolor S238N-H82]|uniref:Predicted protein n=1 Tax=Laccaria bicolor (strain S238N-H82 / ATCC MYA-4686) TaxID=486041 RepID=B0DYG0_LACBS|nr:uncharacterized protein LACBIDRAFT_314389 [Laccaria bicolor S238N-H82]EDR00379.1 predicted protein [Laccaria bicolor S238N-H82]|eukprot:XP_001888938.1 predicted protein [Laccaria bicolor S238N-H82]
MGIPRSQVRTARLHLEPNFRKYGIKPKFQSCHSFRNPMEGQLRVLGTQV